MKENCIDMKILKDKIDKMLVIISIYKNEGKINKDQVYEYLCDCLSWFEVNYKRIEDKNIIKISEEERKKLSGIRYANNMKKHSKNIITYGLITKILYPSENVFPSSKLFPSNNNNVYWNILPLDKKAFENQYNNYNEYICKKEVSETLVDAYVILKKVL